MKKHQTILFLQRNDGTEVLLAMKKRGFGEGKWNGTGGKVEEGETAEDAIIRETMEEVGVTVREENLKHHGTIEFIFPESNGLHIQGEVYTATFFEGEPVETEEMKPKWFPIDAIPYEDMWVGDSEWIPLVLSGKNISGTLHFNEDGSEVLSIQMDSRDQ